MTAVIAIDLLLVPLAIGVWAHNRMLGRAEAVDAAWAQVESNLQRRADLIPRLVETVNRYLRHESQVLTDVVRERGAALAEAQAAFGELERAQRARAEARAAHSGAAAPDAEALAALSQHEAAVGRGVRMVLAVAERYPELRSGDQFLALQAQLEGTENRINVARMAFNEAVRRYNAALVQLPTSFVASAQGLERRPYFGADASTHAAAPLSLE